MIPIILIAGPTCSGKSIIATQLAGKNGEIVNGDSRQIYRKLLIGTAAPTEIERKKINHHLYNFLEPDKRFNAGLYKEKADKIIKNIHQRNKIPFIVGGTGLYINALLGRLFEGPGRNTEIRKEIENKADKNGWDSVYEELNNIDPDYTAKIHKNDHLRIVRALEVYKITGIPISKIFKNQKRQKDYKAIWIGIDIERQLLYKRINERVDKMFEIGFVDEVKTLLEEYPKDIPAFESIGYREIIDYLEGKLSLDETKEKVKMNTRRYAKRQLTWFRKEKAIKWYPPEKVKMPVMPF